MCIWIRWVSTGRGSADGLFIDLNLVHTTSASMKVLSWTTPQNKLIVTRLIHGDWEEVLEELYVLWVEAQILQCGIQSNAETREVGATRGWLQTRPRRRSVAYQARLPTTKASFVASQQTSQLARPNQQGYCHVTRPPMWLTWPKTLTLTPNCSWLLLAQAGYESW